MQGKERSHLCTGKLSHHKDQKALNEIILLTYIRVFPDSCIPVKPIHTCSNLTTYKSGKKFYIRIVQGLDTYKHTEL